MNVEPTRCARCGAPAVVGLGDAHEREWLCLAHFDDALRDVVGVVAAIEEAIGGAAARVVTVEFGAGS